MNEGQPKRVDVNQLDEENDLIWIKKSNELDELEQGFEGFQAHLLRKCRENPLVPLGVTATVSALGYGVWSFMKGDRLMSQYMMRARVAAQGFTIVAIVGGLLYHSPRKT